MDQKAGPGSASMTPHDRREQARVPSIVWRDTLKSDQGPATTIFVPARPGPFRSACSASRTRAVERVRSADLVLLPQVPQEPPSCTASDCSEISIAHWPDFALTTHDDVGELSQRRTQNRKKQSRNFTTPRGRVTRALLASRQALCSCKRALIKVARSAVAIGGLRPSR